MNQSIPNLTELTAIADDDEFIVVDKSDTTDGATGTNKKITKRSLGGGGMNNLLKNGNFINNSTNGYGSTPDNWTNSAGNPVQGGFPSMTKQQLIDLLGITDGDIEGLWNLNEASGNATDLSSNAYHLTDTNTVGASDDGLMGKARSFNGTDEYFTIADASCANLEINGANAKTFFCYIKPSDVSSVRNIFGKSGASATQSFYLTADGKVNFLQSGLTPNTLTSDIILEANKWYFLVGVFTGSASNLYINGIKKAVATTGTATDTNGNFRIGTDNAISNLFAGSMQAVGVLSVALTDSQVKKLFAATMYRGQKIRRATTDALLTQALPEDLVERLRGKEVSVVAKAYQEVASTAQVSIDDGTETASATVATTGSWLNLGATKTISATATTITLKLKHSTSDGNTWFKEVAFYEGGTLVYVWYPSYDDQARFPSLLDLIPTDYNKGYRAYKYGFSSTALVTTINPTVDTNTEIVRSPSITVKAGQKVRLSGIIQGQNNDIAWSGWLELHRDSIAGNGLYGRVECIEAIAGNGNSQSFCFMDEPGAGSFVYIMTGGVRGAGTRAFTQVVNNLQVSVE